MGGTIHFGGGNSVWSFRGLVDEMSVYTKALSSQEIVDIFNAGPDGKCMDSEDLVELIGDYLEELKVSGEITSKDATQLDERLDKAMESLAAGNTNLASNQLKSFGNKVNALVNSGRISQQQGELLARMANTIADSI